MNSPTTYVIRLKVMKEEMKAYTPILHLSKQSYGFVHFTVMVL